MTDVSPQVSRPQGLDAVGGESGRSVDDWVLEMRRISLDDLRRRGIRSQRATFKDRLLPLNSRGALELSHVLYSESAWAAGTLAICFLTFLFFTGSLWGAIAIVLIASLVMLPILIAWAALGYYYVRKSK